MRRTADAGWHNSFDQQNWLLLPEDNIIDLFHNALGHKVETFFVKREQFPDIPVCLLLFTATNVDGVILAGNISL